MTSFDLLVLLLPVAFMVHDFEEIILFRWFLRKNAARIAAKFPRTKGLIATAGKITTPAFTLVVAEEFLIVSVISFTAVYFHYYPIWIAAFMAFFLHFLIHIAQCLVFRSYTPGVVTSLLLTPACMYMLRHLLAQTVYTFSDIAVLSGLGLAVMIVNVVFMHYWAGNLKL